MTPSLEQRVRRFAKNLDRPTPSDVVHIRTLRKAIGGIALCLPLALVLGEQIRDLVLSIQHPGLFEASISAYFHTGMRELFVGSLCAVAVFLLCYKGYERRDNLAANVAGLALVMVAFFPTSERPIEPVDGGAVIDSATLFSDARTPDPDYVSYTHFGAAAVFFVILAVMSLFLFTRTAGTKSMMTDQKRQRNVVYRACGITILVCIGVIAIGKLAFSDALGESTPLVFWCEAIAVMAFGLSWLTKAEVILADRPDQSPAERAMTVGV